MTKEKELQKITTIKLVKETKLRLEKLREHKRESYDDILRKILYILSTVRYDPEKAKKILETISERRAKRIKEEREQKEEQKKEEQIN